MKSNAAKKLEKCKCPYCDQELEAAGAPFCQPCGVALKYCPSCRKVAQQDATVCPHCGGKLELKQ